MKILEIRKNKKQYMELLLLADEQEDMIDKYIDRGIMFILEDNGVKSECVRLCGSGGAFAEPVRSSG